MTKSREKLYEASEARPSLLLLLPLFLYVRTYVCTYARVCWGKKRACGLRNRYAEDSGEADVHRLAGPDTGDSGHVERYRHTSKYADYYAGTSEFVESDDIGPTTTEPMQLIPKDFQAFGSL